MPKMVWEILYPRLGNSQGKSGNYLSDFSWNCEVNDTQFLPSWNVINVNFII